MQMGLLEIILIGIGLSMDAVAVSMTNGLCYKRFKFKHALVSAFAFGLFQGLMPLIGYYAGSMFSEVCAKYDHWIALILLGFIGGKMIYDGVHHDASDGNTSFTLKILFLQAFATSIDALAVGVSFTNLVENIYFAVVVIAITTFALSFAAVYIGKKLGDKLNNKAEIFGGTILVLIGLKIFVEHMWLS